eukprot:scaffold22500_cov157-Skeletonema_marinoi.AAC.1
METVLPPRDKHGELHYDDKILRFENDPDDRAYILSLSGEAEAALTDTIPVTFVDVVDGKLKLKSRGPKLAEPPLQEHLSFIEALRSKGGEWMWKGLVLDEDPDWIIDALERGSLAKHAVQQAIADDASFRTTIYSLPLEQASVFFDGSKQTSDIAKELRYQIGRRNARQFYQDEKIMDNSTFDSIAWADLRSILEKRPKIRWDPDASDSCPNCGRFETADHLTRCDSRIRRDLLKESIRDLDDWMSWHCTHPDLRLWIPRYFGGQGRRLFVDLVHPEGRKMSQNMRIVGNKIDRIGWRHFTEGKLPTAFRDMQRQHLLPPQDLTIDVWMK